MDSIETVMAFFTALDSPDWERAGQYLSDDYQLVDFLAQPMNKEARLELQHLLRESMPDLKHSLSKIRMEDGVVKLSVQRSGRNSAPLDLRKLGIGLVPKTRRFIIFPNADFEFTVRDGKITLERDISPVSPSRRMSGLLRAMGVSPYAT